MEHIDPMIADPGGRTEPHQHINAFAPNCPKCDVSMKPWMIVPCRFSQDLVVYRCKQCGSEVNRSVPK